MVGVGAVIGIVVAVLAIGFFLILWSAKRTARKKEQEKKDHTDKEYTLKEMELKVKQLEVELPTKTLPQVRHITCKYCGYATPEDMIKCQHCGASM